jgi:hypothetical protein
MLPDDLMSRHWGLACRAEKIWLDKDSSAILEKLRALGFEPSRASAGKTLTGLPTVDKLDALAQIAAVQFVSPVRR